MHAAAAWLFEKIFLDLLCGNYATRPSSFAFIYAGIIGVDSAHFQIVDTIYENMNSWAAAWLYSLQIFLQIDSGDLMPQAAGIYWLMVGEKIIGLMVFSIFVVSYTRKVIK